MNYEHRKPLSKKFNPVRENDKAKAQFALDLRLVINKITLNPIGWCLAGMRSTLISHKIAKQ
jgi:hypothetical protein